MKDVWKYLVFICFAVISDQLSKGFIQETMTWGESFPVLEGFFNITYVRNTGAAFGFLAQGANWLRYLLFLALPVIICLWLLVAIYQERKQKKILAWAYTLILAGAIGNLIDRFSLGYVVDFLDFYCKSSHFPAFNIADSCITIGAGFLILDYIKSARVKRAADPS